MKQIKVLKVNNKQPFYEWYNSLDKTAQIRITKRLSNLQCENYGDCKVIDKDIKELRFTFNSGYRIYFHETNKTIIILLCGGDKSSQSRNIKKAKEHLKYYKEQKNEQN